MFEDVVEFVPWRGITSSTPYPQKNVEFNKNFLNNIVRHYGEQLYTQKTES